MNRAASVFAVVLAVVALFLGGQLFHAHANTVSVETACLYDLPVTGGAAVFSSSLTPSKAGSIFLVTVCVDGADSTIVPLVKRGTEEWREIPLNGASGDIPEDQLHTFSFGACSNANNSLSSATNLSYNFKLGTSCTIVKLSVIEQVNQ
jgi:hypothetical protein